MEEEVTPTRLNPAPQPDCEAIEAEIPIKQPYNDLDLLKMHNVYFKFLDAGCTIHVGCKTYAFSNVNVALEEFNSYVKNPSEAHEKWNN